MSYKMSDETQLTVYRVDSRLRDSSIKAVLILARELWQNRWHVATRYKAEFKSRFSQTMLGVIWQFVEAVLPISAYALLGYIAVFPARDDMPALVYIAIGITCWMLMTDAITRQMGAVHSNKVMLNKSSFPLVGVLAAAFAQSAFDTLVRIATICIIYALMIGAPPWRALLAIPMMMPMVLFAVGLGMALAVINAVYRDVEGVVQIFLRYGFFLSLVIFPLPDHPLAHRLSQFNPFAVFIDDIRSMLVFGHVSDWGGFAVWSGVTVVLFIIGAKLVYLMEPRIRGFL